MSDPEDDSVDSVTSHVTGVTCHARRSRLTQEPLIVGPGLDDPGEHSRVRPAPTSHATTPSQPRSLAQVAALLSDRELDAAIDAALHHDHQGAALRLARADTEHVHVVMADPAPHTRARIKGRSLSPWRSGKRLLARPGAPQAHPTGVGGRAAAEPRRAPLASLKRKSQL